MTTYDPTACGACGRRLLNPRPLGLCDDCRPRFVAELITEYCGMSGSGEPDDPSTQAAVVALNAAIDLARAECRRQTEVS